MESVHTSSFPFHVAWDPYVAKLRPPSPSLTEKIIKVFWNILSVIIPIIGLYRLLAYGISTIAKRFIVPIAYDTLLSSDFNISQIVQQNFPAISTSSHDIITPDGITLRATVLSAKGEIPRRKALLFFNPNAANSSDFFTQTQQIVKDVLTSHQCIFFDYRTSPSLQHPRELIIDGYSVARWAQTHLKIAADQLAFYGFSLGGSIAAQTAALRDDWRGKIIIDRSFASTNRVLTSHYQGCMGQFVCTILKQQKMYLDTIPALEILENRRQPLLVLSHKKDKVIPKSAQLHDCCKSPFTKKLLLEENLGIDPHLVPINVYTQPYDTILKFLQTDSSS